MADVSRRVVLAGGAELMAAATPMAAGAAEETLAWGFTFPSIEEGTLALGDYRGRVLLVTNTASFCGFTYQYEQLEALHKAMAPRGLTVVGIPSQDFNQESGTNAAVKAFCDATFGVLFPMAGLTHVRGAEAHPFYQWVKATRKWEPAWNFNKVLIGRGGRIEGLFRSADEPNGHALTSAITTALGPVA
jgi:glutathione peroxidase